MKLEPTEAQRKALVDKLGEHVQWHRDGVELAVDEMIAAANSIPEGAPVGTIARRPDGEWAATRRYSELWKENQWIYVYVGAAPTKDHPLPALSDADSWPVIYDPREYESTEYEPETGLHWFKPGEEPLVPRPDPTAQQEPEDPGPPSNAHIKLAKPPRTPRVVDRLGVDERGSRWRNRAGLEFWHDGTRWVSDCPFGDLYGEDYEPDALPPYTEILEPQPKAERESSPKSSPRVLPSLDCEEARDGTEWQFRLNGEPRSLVYRNVGWRYGEVGDPIGSRCGIPDGHNFIREFAPYIEVLGDPS